MSWLLLLFQASRGHYQHVKLNSTLKRYDVMTSLKEEMKEVDFANVPEDYESPIAHSFPYLLWGANKLIVDELIRNLSLTFGTVLVVIFLLVADARVSIAVSACVVLTVSHVSKTALSTEKLIFLRCTFRL